MRYYCLLLVLLSLLSCNENLLEKPDDLIPEDKMVSILTDLAIVNAAKSTNMAVLQDLDIEPMDYIFKKYDIDSLQFVESDRYYASLPPEYEEIYKRVESKLEEQAKTMEEAKRVNDSLRRMESEENRDDTD
ncbi:DUF4296 domain-containing protein [Pricia sp. S334]|uniref:DUF4296 domain-containing protein n=1 Tax=Pricia mediterranea TaxID=3076079 RepID=A0ABU3L6J7_9FLAO|nr:DUF4296 domain-containing protein [Pricia sp. S334]MDT7829188.1 DUF4296 domain-containing protein [Pricia sp. S334]